MEREPVAAQETFAFVEPPVGPDQRIEPIAFGASRLYIGTCGYSYKDWIGPFYPERIKPAAMLPFYAERFSAVEIDSSYYGVPHPRTVASMAARTRPGSSPGSGSASPPAR